MTPSSATLAPPAAPRHLRVPRLAGGQDPWPYRDVFVRDNFDDDGNAPSSGTVHLSPDIIPYQGGTLDVAQAIATYGGPDIGKPFVQHGANNIYVRAKNLQPAGTESGTVQLYFCPSSLFMIPSQWTGNEVLTAGNTNTVSFVNAAGSMALNPGDICLTAEAFFLDGLPPTTNGDHYCLIAVVNTPNETTTIPSCFDSNAAFVAWVQNTPTVAWRNLWRNRHFRFQ